MAQISIETAQSNLDCSVLKTLPGKQIMVGGLDLNDHTVESAATVVARIKRALQHIPKEKVIRAPVEAAQMLRKEYAWA